LKNHFKPLTIAGAGMILFCFFFLVCTVMLGIFIWMDITEHSSVDNLEIIFMIISLSSLGLSIIIPILFEIIDIIINKRGIWKVELQRSVTKEEYNQIVPLLRQKGYIVSPCENKLIATKPIPGLVTSTAFIVFEHSYDTTTIEIYRETFNKQRKTLLFGAWGMLFKRSHRKSVATILGLVNAPNNIRV